MSMERGSNNYKIHLPLFFIILPNKRANLFPYLVKVKAGLVNNISYKTEVIFNFF
jgi:hypothetical protein